MKSKKEVYVKRSEEVGGCIVLSGPYLFLFLSEAVPHGGHYLGHLSKGSIGVGALDGCLGVSEEQGVGRNWFRGFVGVLLLLLLGGLGLFGSLDRCRSLLCLMKKGGRNGQTICASGVSKVCEE